MGCCSCPLPLTLSLPYLPASQAATLTVCSLANMAAGSIARRHQGQEVMGSRRESVVSTRQWRWWGREGQGQSGHERERDRPASSLHSTLATYRLNSAADCSSGYGSIFLVFSYSPTTLDFMRGTQPGERLDAFWCRSPLSSSPIQSPWLQVRVGSQEGSLASLSLSAGQWEPSLDGQKEGTL